MDDEAGHGGSASRYVNASYGIDLAGVDRITFGTSKTAMTAIQLRTEVKKLVDKTSDLGFLEQLKQLLLRSEADRAAFVEMNRMADLSDEAIRKGEVHTHEEVVDYLRNRRKRK